MKLTETEFGFHTTPRGKRIPDRKCKACKNLWLSEYRDRHPGQYAQYARVARNKDPDKTKANKKEYRSRPHVKRKTQEYSASRKDLDRRLARNRYATEAGRIVALNKRQRRRMRRLNALTDKSAEITDAWLTDLFNRYEHKCAYCGIVDSRLTMDHVTPVSRGGKHEPNNIVPACHLCNSVKKDSLVDEWRPWVVIPGYGLDLATA